MALSAGSLIMSVADHVTVRSGGMVMLHDPAAITIGDAAAHTKTASVLSKMAEQYAAFYDAAIARRKK